MGRVVADTHSMQFFATLVDVVERSEASIRGDLECTY
jgi:hypothetical protein